MKLVARLAHNEKKERTKALKLVSRFLSREESISETEMLKLWKGLFYSMWMCDKQHAQMDLASRICSLVHNLKPKVLITFLRTFFDTICREWPGLDRFRVDKFYMFVRKMVRAMFQEMSNRHWDIDFVTDLVTVFEISSMRPKVPSQRGVCMHMIDVYFPELIAVVEQYEGDSNLVFAAFKVLISPLAILLSTETDTVVSDRVLESAFLPAYEEMSREKKDNEEEEEQANPEEIPIRKLFQIMNAHKQEIAEFFEALASSNLPDQKRRKDLYDLVELLSQV